MPGTAYQDDNHTIKQSIGKVCHGRRGQRPYGIGQTLNPCLSLWATPHWLEAFFGGRKAETSKTYRNPLSIAETV